MRACRRRPRVAMATPGRRGAAALLLAVAAVLPPARGFSLPLQRPADCGDARYFDISRLACGPCGAHQRQSAGGERPGPAARGEAGPPGRGGRAGSAELRQLRAEIRPQHREMQNPGSGFGGKTAVLRGKSEKAAEGAGIPQRPKWPRHSFDTCVQRYIPEKRL